MAVVREIGAWVIGLTVWGSVFGFMVHGLWTGAWYGYVFGTLLLMPLALRLLVPRYCRMSDEEILRMIREREQEEEND